MMHIKQTLPDIKARISSSLQKYSSELAQLGDSILGNNGNIVLNIITEFSNEYRTVLEGNNQELSSMELSGGARISFVFHELYSNGIKAVDPFDQVKDIDIRTILYNSSGSSPALFVGTTAFELIVKQQIKRLEEPSLKCVSLVYDEMVRILGGLLNKQLFRRYPMLKEKVHAVVITFFKRAMEPTNKLVKDLIAMEACYVNTGHPDFLNGHRVSDCHLLACFPGLTEQAMTIINERQNASKPTQVDPKTGKPLPQRASSPTVDAIQESSGSSFFGSFWASKNKKKMAAMEAPPATLKASASLSERESTEVEVISKLTVFVAYEMLTLQRTAHHVVLQHCQAHYDRYGSEGRHVHACPVRIPLSLLMASNVGKILQGRDAARTAGEHVPQHGTGRTTQGKRLHDPSTKGMPANGGESDSRQRDREPSPVMPQIWSLDFLCYVMVDAVQPVLGWVVGSLS